MAHIDMNENIVTQTFLTQKFLMRITVCRKLMCMYTIQKVVHLCFLNNIATKIMIATQTATSIAPRPIIELAPIIISTEF